MLPIFELFLKKICFVWICFLISMLFIRKRAVWFSDNIDFQMHPAKSYSFTDIWIKRRKISYQNGFITIFRVISINMYKTYICTGRNKMMQNNWTSDDIRDTPIYGPYFVKSLHPLNTKRNEISHCKHKRLTRWFGFVINRLTTL